SHLNFTGQHGYLAVRADVYPGRNFAVTVATTPFIALSNGRTGANNKHQSHSEHLHEIAPAHAKIVSDFFQQLRRLWLAQHLILASWIHRAPPEFCANIRLIAFMTLG